MRSTYQSSLALIILLCLVSVTSANAEPSQLDRIEDKINKLQDDLNLLKSRNLGSPDVPGNADLSPTIEHKISNCSGPLGLYGVACGGERLDFWVDDGLVM